jgi:hypothetical protein
MNDNQNLTSCASQNDKIQAWLEDGRSITSWDAIMMFSCTRLAARIHDIRERGINVKVRKKITPKGTIVAEYYL